MGEPVRTGGTGPRILVFSTNTISDPGIDLAGSSHMNYPATVRVISLPCSSGVRPTWVVHALEAGFDGVFIAADGTDCAFLPDCTSNTANLVQKAQALLRDRGKDPRRIKMAAICSVCSEAFVSHIRQFGDALRNL